MAMPDVASPGCTEPDSMGLRYPEPVAFWSELQPGVSCVPRCLADANCQWSQQVAVDCPDLP